MRGLKLLDRLLLFSLIFTLFIGNLLDVFFTFPLKLLDIVVILIFIRSLVFIKHRVKNIDIGILSFALFNVIVLWLNNKHLFNFSSFLYLFRIFLYLQTYPFFVYIFLKIKSWDNLKKVVPLFLVFHLIVFSIFKNLTVLGYDPHISRLYGPFLDPNYYAILLVLLLTLFFNLRHSSNLDFFTVLLTLVSIFLTFSRVGFLLLLLLLLTKYLLSKNSKYLGLLFGFLILTITNNKYLLRMLFVGGNSQSFIYRIRSYIDGISIYSLNLLPLGYNNILINKYFLTSNLNMSSSFTDSVVLNLLLTGGIFNLLIVIFAAFVLAKKLLLKGSIAGFTIIVFILFSSFVMNVLFQPYFIIIISILVAYSLVLNKPLKRVKIST